MITSVFIPALVVVMMVIVGAGLQLRQFTAMLRIPVPLIGGTLAQVLLLPLGALIIVQLLHPPPELAAGLLLVAACPGGALSNYYCHIGRLNVALSVSLTAVSSIAAFAVLPLILAIIFPAGESVEGLVIPIADLVTRLVLFLLLPIAVGMLLRVCLPGLVERHERHVRLMSVFLVLLLLFFIVTDQWETTRLLFFDAAILAALFSGVAALAGWVTGFLLGLSRIDKFVFSVEFATRNIGVAAVVAVASLGRPEFVTFGAVFVVVQFPLVVLLLYAHHRGRVNRASGAVGCNDTN